MKLYLNAILFFAAVLFPVSLTAQVHPPVHGADQRYKADILVVVAHPDDEGFFTPYLARAINELHKRVAVVFSTRGGSGGNHYGRERGPALANVREIEAREACAQLGISHVWFLDGKDTASQNLLDSLSNWGHGANLEKLVGLIRLTRPEVVMTHFPGIFVGENHGDHQATGVLTIEAFDLAANPLVFPEQLAGDTRHYETDLSNLMPWQPKKIYFGSDADDGKQFVGTGPAYSIMGISPSLKKPYWRIAIDSARSHRTQFPEELEIVSKLSDEQLEKIMTDPKTGWWSEPATLIFGKSVVGGKATDDVFAQIEDEPAKTGMTGETSCAGHKTGENIPTGFPRMELGGPWLFYEQFYPAHGLCDLPVAKVPEIGLKTGIVLAIPVVILHDGSKTLPVTLTVKAPEGWKVTSGTGNALLPAESSTAILVLIQTPALSADELKKAAPQEVQLNAEADGKPAGDVHLRVVLRAGGLPQ
jgi:LmbE family N-acetylglucosaminyl deacetylase